MCVCGGGGGGGLLAFFFFWGGGGGGGEWLFCIGHLQVFFGVTFKNLLCFLGISKLESQYSFEFYMDLG